MFEHGKTVKVITSTGHTIIGKVYEPEDDTTGWEPYVRFSDAEGREAMRVAHHHIVIATPQPRALRDDEPQPRIFYPEK